MRKTLLVFAAIYAVGIAIIVWAFEGSTLGKADFTYISGAEPKSLDPAVMTGQLEGRFANAMYEGLTYQEPATLDNVPGMAERWENSPDGRVWTFFLRHNAKWTNGDPVTAHDFHWSWKRALSPELASEYSYMLWDLVNGMEFNKGEVKDFAQVGVKALDDYTLRVTLKHEVPYFLDLTSFYTLAPVHRKSIEAWESDPENPIGGWTLPENVVTNGPFGLDLWINNDRIRLRKNPDYWNADSIRLETIDALSIEDARGA